MYPFSGSISARFLSILFTTINISDGIFLQIIPPSTLSVKVLEIYGIIPLSTCPSVKRLVFL